MKNLLFIFLLGICITAQSQCPKITESSIIQMAPSANLWVLQVHYESDTAAIRSIKYAVSVDTGIITGCFPSILGWGVFQTMPFVSTTPPTYVITAMAEDSCTGSSCTFTLSSESKLIYLNGALYFKGQLKYKPTGKLYNVSPHIPEAAGEYVAIKNGIESNTVYVDKPGNVKKWVAFDLLGHHWEYTQKPLMLPPGCFLKQIK